MKHQPIPTVAMSMPPKAGPMTRLAFMTTPLRLVAFGTSSGPTISDTNAPRAGRSTRFTAPNASDTA